MAATTTTSCDQVSEISRYAYSRYAGTNLFPLCAGRDQGNECRGHAQAAGDLGRVIYEGICTVFQDEETSNEGGHIEEDIVGVHHWE